MDLFSVWLVGGYAHVFALLSDVVVNIPRKERKGGEGREKNKEVKDGEIVKFLNRFIICRLS